VFEEKIDQIFRKVSNMLRRLFTFLKKIRRQKPKDIPVPDKKPSIYVKPVHPWRMCPGGQHYRRHTNVSAYTRTDGTEIGVHPRRGTCANNPSGKDQLYTEEMEQIAGQYFDTFKLVPLPEIPKFGKKGQFYDHFIQGWTQYWNDVLKPNEPLDPHMIKALIASESSFDPNAWNEKHGPGRARGLTQVTDITLRYLSLEKYHELKDHFLHLKEDDTLNPNFSICAGIRWLFRKKEIADSKIMGEVSWIDAVGEYKHYKTDNPHMKEFIDLYESLKRK